MKKSQGYPLLIITAFLLAAYSFSGCKKTTVKPILTLLPAEGLAYIQANSGRYFIYRDSVTNKTDSVVCTESLLETYNGTYSDINVNFTAQRYTVVLSKIDAGVTSVWLGAATGISGPGFQLISSGGIGSGHTIFWDYDTTIPTMVVEGKTYTNVSLSTIPLTSPGNPVSNISSWHYWAKGVGLIKSVEVNGSVTSTYTLVRNN